MPLRLRDYIYLDDDLVERLLSQAEHGVHDEEQHTDTEKVDKRRGAALRGGPASAQLGRSTGKEISSSKTVRQTPDSACSRLIELLEDDGSLQFLDAFDDEMVPSVPMRPVYATCHDAMCKGASPLAAKATGCELASIDCQRSDRMPLRASIPP